MEAQHYWFPKAAGAQQQIDSTDLYGQLNGIAVDGATRCRDRGQARHAMQHRRRGEGDRAPQIFLADRPAVRNKQRGWRIGGEEEQEERVRSS